MNAIIKDRVTAHLETIEAVYGVRIINKTEIAGWISEKTRDEKTALSIATALNTWVMMNSSSGDIKIPFDVMGQIHHNLIKK